MKRRTRKEPGRKVHILPSLVTAGSLFCGLLGIFEVLSPDSSLAQACALIVLAALLDVADGAIARLTRTTSAFGLNFDSLSDLVAFGVAPALITFAAIGESYPRLTTAVCSLFVICGALRLARFNVQANREESKSFLGLPIPSAGLAVISVIWIFETNPAVADLLPLERIFPPAMVILAYLMVSKIPYEGFKNLNFADRQPFEILVTIVVVACLIYVLLHFMPEALCGLSWGYIVVGLARALYQRQGRLLDSTPDPLRTTDPNQPDS
jgi:CDP-diacylglycerol--serine O-phosphatidyltransferase